MGEQSFEHGRKTFKVMVHHTSKSLILLLLTVVTASIAAPPIKLGLSAGDIGVFGDIGPPRFGESSAPGSGSATPLRHQPETEIPVRHSHLIYNATKEPNVSAHDHNAQGDQGKLPISTPTNQNEDGAQQCAICLESLENRQHGEVKKRTNCSHFFHEDCVSKWAKKGATCPLCREVDPTSTSSETPIRRPSMLQQVIDQTKSELRQLEQLPPTEQNDAEITRKINIILDLESFR
ncbi:hypothetical protein KEM48_002377 [Puccinia striiformis f. sp. tritici PST-130]|nr:hypothetical protein KEM48_002377 [Puccinia striiformis f. sp. tritici PST-130]